MKACVVDNSIQPVRLHFHCTFQPYTLCWLKTSPNRLMKLKYQLFLVLLLASAVLISLMLTINSVNFHRQFISYVNTVQMKRLEPLVAELSSRYSEANNWSWINRDTWHTLLRQHAVETRSGRLRTTPKDREPPASLSNTRDRPRTLSKRGWLTLSDKDHSIIIGAKIKPNMQWLSVSVDGRVAGYVGFARHNKFSRRIDQEFAWQQRRSFIFAALVMVALCALISAPLASRIIRPLRPVNNAIRALSNGDYAHRAEVNRKDEFGQLAGNINQLGDTLEQNKAARQRWIAEISHELRTPVSVLQGEIEAIQDGLRPLEKNTVDSLHMEVLRLSRLIDDLHQLSVSDLGALEYKMEPLNLGILLEEFLDGHAQTLAAATIQLQFKRQNTTILGDRERFCQLLENLMQNTLRYTNAPGSLEVCLIPDRDDITLTWSDSAPGVSKDDLIHLFEPLYRADQSRNRKTSGSGLGLAIVHKIVSAHHGSITALHSPTGGLLVQLIFPKHHQ